MDGDASEYYNPDGSEEKSVGDEFLQRYIDGELPKDLIMTPEEVLSFGVLQDIPLPRSNESHYAAHLLSLYAHEDTSDQPLAKAAQARNIDLVVLTNMPGSYQVVTEILDARPRVDSFRSLIYLT